MAAAAPVAASQVMRLFEGARLSAVAAAHTGGGNPGAGRFAVVVITIAAVSAFTVLQVMARSRRRRSPRQPDWWTFAPRQEDEPGDDGRPGDDEALFADQESAGYAARPGYSASPRPPWNWLRIMRTWEHLAD